MVVLLVACALSGAFAIGRLAKISSPQVAGPLPAAITAQAMPAAMRLVPTGRQQAEIETPQGTFTIEAGITAQ